MTRKPTPHLTTAQQLGSVIKSARDIMRKDKGPGMDTDLGRLPLLTWVMFLKFLDDMEMVAEDEAEMSGERFRPIIEAPYRWRDWAANPSGITGEALLDFINAEKTHRADGTEGAGLFAYLRGLQSHNGRDRRDIIAAVFRELNCPMRSGFLLRDVINKVHLINFASQEELFTLGTLYESLLKEMRDAAGQNGEFYTPRPVVRFMVAVVDPRLGDTVLDPACGTGGFLVETFNHLKAQCRTVADRRILQEESLFGGEAKPLPYLLCQMNLLLHGLEFSQIDAGNSLRQRVTEIGERDRVDVVLTNPPFGGEEEAGIRNNFPGDRQTSETALLFLQLIMRKLHRLPKPGRAAVVVPNGTLFGDGVCARIKEELLKEFNLHTIVRLPNGVFSPYTSIPTNLLFFDRAGPTREVWYYEQPLPEGRKNYTKTQPIQFEEFAPCIAWWKDRQENERAWKLPAAEILASGCNLDRKNPNAAAGYEQMPPEQLVEDILAKELRIAELLREIREILGRMPADGFGGACLEMREVLTPRKPDTPVDQEQMYQFAGVYCFGRELFRGAIKAGVEFSYPVLTRLRTGDFIYPKLMAWDGALGVVPPECDGLYVSPEFPVFEIDTNRILPEVLEAYFRLPSVWRMLGEISTGTNARRRRLQPSAFLGFRMPLPPMRLQKELCELNQRVSVTRRTRSETAVELDALLPAVLERAFRGML